MSAKFEKTCLITVDGIEHTVTMSFDYSSLSQEELVAWAGTKWVIAAQDKMRLGKLEIPASGVYNEVVKALGTRSPADISDKIEAIRATALEMGIELTSEQALIIYKKSREKAPKAN